VATTTSSSTAGAVVVAVALVVITTPKPLKWSEKRKGPKRVCVCAEMDEPPKKRQATGEDGEDGATKPQQALQAPQAQGALDARTSSKMAMISMMGTLAQQQAKKGATTTPTPPTPTTTPTPAPTTTAAAAASERRWELLPLARVLGRDYLRVVLMPGARVCYQVDPLVSDMAKRARPDVDVRRSLWRMVMTEFPSAEILSIKRDSRDFAQLAAIGCDAADNMLVTAAGALAGLSGAASVQSDSLAEVRAALADLVDADRKIADALLSNPNAFSVVSPSLWSSSRAGAGVAPQQSLLSSLASPAAATMTKRDHMARLVQMMNEMRS
jgi:hypothetical protein